MEKPTSTTPNKNTPKEIYRFGKNSGDDLHIAAENLKVLFYAQRAGNDLNMDVLHTVLTCLQDVRDGAEKHEVA